MSKSRKRLRRAAVILLAVCLLPFPTILKDGGTKIFHAVLYKVVVWHRLRPLPEGGYKTGVEFIPFPRNFRQDE